MKSAFVSVLRDKGALTSAVPLLFRRRGRHSTAL